MTWPPVIRRVRHADLDALIALYRHLNPEDEPLPSPAIVEAVWQSMLQDPRLICLVAGVGEQLVGSCTLAILPNLSRGARPYGLIENVVTHAGFRGRGIGTSLLRQALALAWQQRCYKVLLLTGSKRESTLRFYERAGFQRGKKEGLVAYPSP